MLGRDKLTRFTWLALAFVFVLALALGASLLPRGDELAAPVSVAGLAGIFKSLGNALKKGFTSTAGKAILGTAVAAGATALVAKLGGSPGQGETPAQINDRAAAEFAKRGTAAQFFSTPVGIGVLVAGAGMFVLLLTRK